MRLHQRNYQGMSSNANSLIVKHMQELSMYERREPPRNFHGHSSLVQSAPHHSQPLNCSGSSHCQHQPRPLLEHLDMSSTSSSLSNTCSCSKCVPDIGSSSTSFVSHHSLNCSTAEGETDRPINYSLKHSDISSRDRDKKSSLSDNVAYGYVASGVGGSIFRPHMESENSRHAMMKEHNCLQTNTTACDKLAADLKGSGPSLNSTTVSTHRPVANLEHSLLHTTNGHRSVRVPPRQHSLPQTPRVMATQTPYANTSYDSVKHLCSSDYSNNPNSYLSNVALCHSGYSSKSQLFNRGANHMQTLQSAHQNTLHPSLLKQSNYGANRIHTLQTAHHNSPHQNLVKQSNSGANNIHTLQTVHQNAPYQSLVKKSNNAANQSHTLQTAHQNSPHQSLVRLSNNGANNIHTLQIAHQNAPHQSLASQFNNTANQIYTLQTTLPSLVSKYNHTETDLDTVFDQPTDFSLRHNESLENHTWDDHQEKLFSYSARFHDSSQRDYNETGTFRSRRHCDDYTHAGAGWTNDNSSNCDQVKTFCTEGTPNLSAVNTLTDLTQAWKVEREEMAMDVPYKIKCAIEMGRAASSTDMTAASVSGSQTLVKQTVLAAAIAACKKLELGAVTPKCTSHLSDDQIAQENFYSCVDFNEGALDQTKTYCEEGTPISFSPVSSHSSHDSAHPGDGIRHVKQTLPNKMELACIGEAGTPKSFNMSIIDNKKAACPVSKCASNVQHTDMQQVLTGNLELKGAACLEDNQIEETPPVLSRCSSPESLSSCEKQSIHSSVASEYSSKASEVVSPSQVPDSPSELMSPSLDQTLTSGFKDMPLSAKFADGITKQSWNLKKIPSTVKAESCGEVPVIYEKSINFVKSNAGEIQTVQMYSDYDDNQLINLPSLHREQESPDLLFSILQKNIPSTNSHFMNSALNSQDKVTPMVEQELESESSSGNSELLVEYAEEGTPQDFSGTSSLSAITIASSSAEDVCEYSNLQHQSQEPDLPTGEKIESGSQIVDAQEEPASFSVDIDSKHLQETVKHEDRNTSLSEVSDSSVSDVSQEEENILAQCISSGMPTHTLKCKRRSRIPVKINSEASLENAAKISSIPKSVPKKLASLFSSPPSDMKSVEIVNCSQMGIPQNNAGSKSTQPDRVSDDGKRSPSRDSHLSSSSCSSSTLPRTKFSKGLKQIGSNVESPESRIRLGAVFELSSECSVLEQAYFQSVPIQLRSEL
ncbi:hypothetical protein BsWGS_28802 [Bradybaena similaris]